MAKVWISQEEKAILNVYMLNNNFKILKAELKEKRDKSTILAVNLTLHFNKLIE